ncbi:hypothetical protein [Glaciibacter superstes]|uniref:hypothetical protein n=1 Tax=Glaciibacter superstes TaxID=501023 RepID=UPI0003B5BD8A|nr:hypothetical protein [Glaciibacter superstes]
MDTVQPRIDEILTSFFTERLIGATGMVRKRILRVEALLRECLESEGEEILVPADRVVLAAEREFGPSGAFARTMYAEDLVFVLCLFVKSPWLQGDRLLQPVQLQVVKALVTNISVRDLIDLHGLACMLLDIGADVRAATWNLNKDRREKQRLRRRAERVERVITANDEYRRRADAGTG